MAWAVGNARVEPKGNAILVTKQASGSAKIDPLMAAFNAIALMATNPMAQFSHPGYFGSRACTRKSSLLGAACSMSALPLIAAQHRTFREVRFVPDKRT
jgi:hypothetical protein